MQGGGHIRVQTRLHVHVHVDRCKEKNQKKTHLEPREGRHGHADMLHVHADADEYRERSKINKKNLRRDIGMGMGTPCMLTQGLQMRVDGCIGM